MANGEKYVGEFKDGLRNGFGTLTMANGEKYVGNWKNDKFKKISLSDKMQEINTKIPDKTLTSLNTNLKK